MDYDYDEEDEEDERFNVFEDGHWIWDTEEESLKFISHKVFTDEDEEPVPPVSDDITFRLDVELLEQVVFKKKFYRKVKEGAPDIITIQDIKDVVLFTAPKGNLNFKLICTLHTCAYERFVRSLIVYTQYYLQVRQVMTRRMSDSAKKIRLPESDIIEKELENNLADFRSLVGRDFLYLHLDDSGIKKRSMMIGVEMRYTEMLVRISIQIVWIALLRPNFESIEIELNRVFRSEIFNLSLHRAGSDPPELSIYERAVFNREKKSEIVVIDKFKQMSPAAKDLLLYPQDYRHVGIGVIGYKRSVAAERIEYLDDIFCSPEEYLLTNDYKIGILGEERSKYDMMLREIVTVKSGGSKSQSAVTIKKSVTSRKSSKSKWSLPAIGTFEVPAVFDKRYADVFYVESHQFGSVCEVSAKCGRCICGRYKLPKNFPDTPPNFKLRQVNKKQKLRWLKYIKPKSKKSKFMSVIDFDTKNK